MKKVLSMLLVLMMIFTLVACGNNVENNANNVANETANNTEANEPSNNDSEVEETVPYYPLTLAVGDQEVIIEAEPMRVISMAPSMTEMVFALGLGDKLVGRTDYCNYPEAALAVESIGSLREPNIEAIIALNPDLVLMSTHASEEAAAKFEEAGIKYVVLMAQESFEGVYELLGHLGTIFNVTETSEALIADMQADVTSILDKIEGVEKKSVYYVVGFGEYGDWTATGDTFIHDMLEMAGGENVAAAAEGWSYNLESLIEQDPEYVIITELNDKKAEFETTEGYADLTAVKDGKVLTINQDLLSRQGPRLAQGLEAIAKILHPDLFE